MPRVTNDALTDIEVRNLPVPKAGKVQYPDGQIRGFGVRVSAKGLKSFYLTYRVHGKNRRLMLGHYPHTTLSKARAKAHAALSSVKDKSDPKTKAVVRPTSFSAALDQFVELYCKTSNRASTAYETERVLRSTFQPLWGTRKLETIAKADVLAVTDKLLRAGKPSAANHAFAAARKLFSWCVARDFIAVSPCYTLKAPAPIAKRTNVIDDKDIAIIWKAAATEVGYPFGTIFQLLTLTGQRRSEVCGMRWNELDLDNDLWNIPASRTKNGHPHSVPLTATALEILEQVAPRLKTTKSPFVFPARGMPDQSYTGYSKGKRELDAKVEKQRRKLAVEAGLESEEIADLDWTLHDLRRTAATRMAELGVLPHVVERVLNHVSGTFGRVAGIYNRFQYADEMREALTVWETHLLGLLKPDADHLPEIK